MPLLQNKPKDRVYNKKVFLWYLRISCLETFPRATVSKYVQEHGVHDESFLFFLLDALNGAILYLLITLYPRINNSKLKKYFNCASGFIIILFQDSLVNPKLVCFFFFITAGANRDSGPKRS